MNDTLARVRSPDSGTLLLPALPAFPALAASATDGAHLTLADRFEMRVGFWLLLRSSRRQHGALDRDDHARRLANARSLTERQHAALRAQILHGART